MNYTCEQCGKGAALCVSDWGYIAALCDLCLKERTAYLKLPHGEHRAVTEPARAGEQVSV
jgi:hypothetical protein